MSSTNTHDKKYLILTLETEFEKVHYPMPLQFQEEVEMASMFKTFQRLQSQIQMSRTQNGFETEAVGG